MGSGDDRHASEDHFLATALDWFGVDIDQAAHAADKGRALAVAVTARRTLLILDGCEPLQYPPGPLAGGLRALGLKALLTHLASAGQPGLCVLTSREWLQDLAEWVRDPGRPDGPVLRLDLGNLDEADGARLLHTLGADRAGAAGIEPDDPELRAASGEVRGHALTLSLLGRYLALAEGGDIRRRDRVDLAAASAATGGHAFRVMAVYETWFARAGAAGARELAALRLLGYFDRPAGAEDLASFRAAPPIPGLTEALFAKPGTGSEPQAAPPEPIPAAQWTIALKRLEEAGLVAPTRPDGGPNPDPTAPGRGGPGRDAPAPADGALDAHPLVREYLAAALKATNPAAFREGHRRLYERLKRSAPHRPEGLAGLQPLHQAVAHGCLAGLWQEVCDQVYFDRILRGTGPDGANSIKKLGAIGADLGAVACLFAEPWIHPAPAPTEGDQAWLLSEAAFRLRALGRLGGGPGTHAGRGGDAGEAGELETSGHQLRKPERAATAPGPGPGRGGGCQALRGPRRPQRRCLLVAGHAHHPGGRLAPTGRDRRGPCTLRRGRGDAGAASACIPAPLLPPGPQVLRPCSWPGPRGPPGPAPALALGLGLDRVGAGQGASGAGDPAAGACEAVAGRARQTLEWAEAGNLSLLTIALDHLTLARCALYADLLAGRPPGAEAQTQAGRALDRLRAAGNPAHAPPRPAHPRLAAPGPGRLRRGPRRPRRRAADRQPRRHGAVSRRHRPLPRPALPRPASPGPGPPPHRGPPLRSPPAGAGRRRGAQFFFRERRPSAG